MQQWLGIVIGIAIALLLMLSCLFVLGIVWWHSSCCCCMQLQCMSCHGIWLCCSSSCSVFLYYAAEFGNIFLPCHGVQQHFSFMLQHFAIVFLMLQHLAMFFFVLQCLEALRIVLQLEQPANFNHCEQQWCLLMEKVLLVPRLWRLSRKGNNW